MLFVKLKNYLNLEIILELGCVISVNVGILVIKVEYLKLNEDCNFVIVDMGMNDMICLVFYEVYM